MSFEEIFCFFYNHTAQCEKSETLLTFDRSVIEGAGYSLITPILVTNTDDFASLEKTDAKTVNAGDSLYKIMA